MKIQLLYAASSISFIGEEYLGISRIHAHLLSINRESILTKLLFDADDEQELAKIDMSCDAFGFSIYNDSAHFIYKAIYYIRKKNKNAIIFLGSQFATNCYELIFEDCEGIDFITLGHGEYAIASFLEAMDKEDDIQLFYNEHPHIVTPTCLKGKTMCHININQLCHPSREIIKSERLLFAGMVTKHGCASNCNFCSVNDKPSALSPKEIYSQIIDIYKNTGIRCFNFIDPSFEDFGEKGKDNVIKFCQMIQIYPVRFSFRCYIRSDSFHDIERDRSILSLMKDVGFNNIFIGIEAGNEKDLKLYNKKGRVEDNYRTIRLFRDIGIEPKIGFIMINPFSDMETLSANFKFLTAIKSPDISHYINCLDLYYNSDIYHITLKNGLLGENYSYINNLACYSLVDPDASKIFEFVRQYFIPSEVFKSSSIFNNFTYTVSYLLPLIGEELNHYIQEEKMISKKLHELHSEYFSTLYIDGDIEHAKRKYQSYVNEVIKLHNSCSALIQGLLRKYIQSNLKLKGL